MLRGLLAAATVTFEYQTSDEEGAALAVNTQQFAEALNEFNSTIFPAAMVAQSGGTSKPWIFTVELRTNPNTDPSTDAWGDRYKNCYGSPAIQTVSVSNLTIHNNQKFDEWLEGSRLCPKAVVWVTGNSLNVLVGEANKYEVYAKIRDKLPNIVVAPDSSGQPAEWAK